MIQMENFIDKEKKKIIQKVYHQGGFESWAKGWKWNIQSLSYSYVIMIKICWWNVYYVHQHYQQQCYYGCCYNQNNNRDLDSSSWSNLVLVRMGSVTWILFCHFNLS